MRRRFLAMATDEDVLAELERGMGGFLERVVVGADPATLRINKVTFLGSGLTLDEIRAELGDAFDVIPASVAVFGTTSGELSLRGVHKATGIEVVIAHLGIPREATVALGDGYNDVEMLAHVGLGIAMGNAPEEVRAVADAVTGTPEEGGVHEALRRHGLI
jgi:hydroxymethylpyrimidine pyrophosphatase-like HAD family hydrolase